MSEDLNRYWYDQEPEDMALGYVMEGMIKYHYETYEAGVLQKRVAIRCTDEAKREIREKYKEIENGKVEK